MVTGDNLRDPLLSPTPPTTRGVVSLNSATLSERKLIVGGLPRINGEVFEHAPRGLGHGKATPAGTGRRIGGEVWELLLQRFLIFGDHLLPCCLLSFGE